MSSYDYVRYLTEQFVKFVDTSKEERLNKKVQKKAERGPVLTRLFGMIPLALLMSFNRKKRR
ncbi:YqzE family protein [Calidifontibacillus erzurumensis]|uniref:YqzE family protein n=1 Tax=Calidifontibacillus erzurumensis TaxID=2741433 RepID=A0A8J8GDB9_9BACI|nr:YqzE family protein [Calidifontibacillus erzurumensis]NSL50358.1 YqzE family protein [Calidifontibacillus erzurumensis]